jgi:hypothetical protein
MVIQRNASPESVANTPPNGILSLFRRPRTECPCDYSRGDLLFHPRAELEELGSCEMPSQPKEGITRCLGRSNGMDSGDIDLVREQEICDRIAGACVDA